MNFQIFISQILIIPKHFIFLSLLDESCLVENKNTMEDILPVPSATYLNRLTFFFFPFAIQKKLSIVYTT